MKMIDENYSEDQFARTRLLIGDENLKRIFAARVAIFGIGGVGGYCVEALARTGIGNIDLIDGDIDALSNLNRQIIAVHNTLGRPKVDVMAERIYDINPHANVKAYKVFYDGQTADSIPLDCYDYIVDAIDSVASKLELIHRAKIEKRQIISSMGAANKLNPQAFLVADIYETSVCPLARVMRRELKKLGISDLKVVYSKEPPMGSLKPGVMASNAIVPAVAGLIIAGEVIKDLVKISEL